MQAAIVVLAAVFGLAVGSFLNVVIWRVPRKLSVASPPSACPGCETPIRPLDNIPVISWMLLRGRCRQCGCGIALRYPLVELGGGVLFAAAAIRFPESWEIPAFAIFFAALLAISIIDLEHFIIPNRILLPLTIAAVPLLGMAAIGEGDWQAFFRALGGGAAAFSVLLVVSLISPKGMGMGDVKFSFVLGLYLGWLGWGEVFLGLFASFLLGAVIGVALIGLGVKSRKDVIPFGPFLALGTVLTILWGEPILRWYTRS
jgi:leader peptidase (prepilin peptidase)/N-methyltransferase